MLRYLIIVFALAFANAPATAHKASKFIEGPNGGHIVDAGGGKQHWELVASGGELTLYITDKDEKPVDTASGSADAQVLVGGKNHKISLSPAGGNTLRAPDRSRQPRACGLSSKPIKSAARASRRG